LARQKINVLPPTTKPTPPSAVPQQIFCDPLPLINANWLYYQFYPIIEQVKSHRFASHPTTHAPLSGASTDLLRSFAIDYSNFRDLFYTYGRVVVGKKKPIGPTGKEIQMFGSGGEFCPMTAPLTPLMIWHPKGGLPASRTWTHYRMALPIKNENLPAMEDCRLLLKNAVDIKLKASVNVKREVASCFLRVVFWNLSVSLSGVNSSGGASEAPNLISPIWARFLVQFSTWATWLAQ
jgi:hypothetical protein